MQGIEEALKVEVDLEEEEVLEAEVQEAITGQGQDFMEDQGHLNTGQEHMEEAVHPGMEDQGRLADVIKIINYF